jgi:hypothetical protein
MHGETVKFTQVNEKGEYCQWDFKSHPKMVLLWLYITLTAVATVPIGRGRKN